PLGDPMTAFGSRDAFPARGGVGDERRFDPVPGTEVPGTETTPAPYVELHAHSAYSFLDGASLPEELAARAAELGYDALALTDHDGVYGSLEFAHAGTRPEGKEHRVLLPAATTIEHVAAHADGLVCLSGCARHGVGVTDTE